METPRDQMYGRSFRYGYGSPPQLPVPSDDVSLMSASNCLMAEQRPPTPPTFGEMQEVTRQIQDMHLEDEHDVDAGRPRLPFQTFRIHQKPRQESEPLETSRNSLLSSPPMTLYDKAAERHKPMAIRKRQQLLVRNAPRLPATPELDFSGSRPEGYLPPPIFSPLYKYSSVNTNALLRESVSANDIAFTTYLNSYNHHETHPHQYQDTNTHIYYQSPTTPSLPPSMPMIGSPSPNVDRKLLKMKKGLDYDFRMLSTPQGHLYSPTILITPRQQEPIG
jgi:hypothetical protein